MTSGKPLQFNQKVQVQRSVAQWQSRLGSLPKTNEAQKSRGPKPACQGQPAGSQLRHFADSPAPKSPRLRVGSSERPDLQGEGRTPSTETKGSRTQPDPSKVSSIQRLAGSFDEKPRQKGSFRTDPFGRLDSIRTGQPTTWSLLLTL